MRNIITILLLLITVPVTVAQNSNLINGYVYTQDKKPLAGITVVLVNTDNEDPVKTSITDANGKYEFEGIKLNRFRILVQHLSFEKHISDAYDRKADGQELPSISLLESSNTLNEVTISAQKAFVTQKIDKIVVRPDALITSAGLTALDVLERAPSVTVDMNGNISIRGKNGVMVLIDGKPSYLSAQDLASYLRSIPASNIENMEIMTNPSAKYDASGNAGIINIIHKKNTAKGFNGGLNLSYGQGKYMRTNNSFNFNYRIQKWNFFSNLGLGKNSSYQDLTIKREYFTPEGERSSAFIQNSYITPEGKSNSIKLGTDFYATKKTTLGASFSGFLNPSERNTANNAVVYDGQMNPVNTIQARNPMDVKFRNRSFNLNMNHLINNEGQQLTVNLDNIVYRSEISQKLLNKVFDTNGQTVSDTRLDSELPSKIKIYSGKVDYSGIPLLGGQADLGAKSSYVHTSNIADFSDVVGNTSTPNYEFSNDFTYKEQIHAIYANYAKDFKNISIQAGLRMEHTRIKGHQAGNPTVADSSFTINYTSLFPTLFIQYRADTLQNNVIGLSLGRRIDRPNYKDLNPFTYPMDRFTFYGGNPYLKPTFSYNAELSHTYKRYLTTTLFYSYVDNLISETNEQRGTIYYSRPGNFATQIAYGISLNATFKLYPWWTLQCYAAASDNSFKSKIYTENIDDSKWNWVVSPTNQFTINDKWSAELSGQYQSKALSGQFLISPIGSVRAGVAMKMLNNKGALKLNVSDIFYTNQIEGEIRNIQNAKASWFSYLDSRVVTLSFSYRFSKGDNVKVRQSGSADTEQKRVKV